ncbi:MAG: nprA [Bacteroidetes bacterium]|nr:nprA [Bacteroidota bacterium]
MKFAFIIKYFFLSLLLFNNTVVFSNKTDSLRALLQNERNDTAKVNLLLKVASLEIRSDSLKAEEEFSKVKELLINLNDKDFVLRSLEKAGKIFYSNDQLSKASEMFYQGLALSKELQRNGWIARFYIRLAEQLHFSDYSQKALIYYDSAMMFSYSLSDKIKAGLFKNKGRAHYDNGDYKKAMELYILSQKIFEKNKWLNKDYGGLLHFIGSVFKRLELYDKALEYYERELKLAKDLNDEDVEAEALYLCAAMYGQMGDIKKDMEYQFKALEIFKRQNNENAIALMLGNISSNYAQLKDYKTAIEFCYKALDIYSKKREAEKEGWVLRALGEYHSRSGKHKEALQFFEKAIAATMRAETKQLLNLSDIKQDMANTYYEMGNYKAAFDTYVEYQSLKDSLNNKENREYLNSLEAQYGSEKKEKEIALLNKDKQMQSAELAKKETQRNAFITVAILIFIIAGLSVYGFFNNRRTAKVLARQVDEINHKNLEIQEKNKDITDSIQYAKRLQDAVFPDPVELSNFFSESFVLFRPKDIVSGDFYWFEQLGNEALLVVGDCTGHGVPGAFMSIMGHNLLNQIVMEEEIYSPAEILNRLDKRVSATLNKRSGKQEHHDGMDIAVCLIRKAQKKIIYAGANRPLLVNRKNSVLEIKPDKYSVGGVLDSSVKVFTEKELKLDEEDILYLFSDGYQDQFGGTTHAAGKKLKYKRLQELLVTTPYNNLKHQSESLDRFFEEWKGNLEQIDDVTVIGIKVS